MARQYVMHVNSSILTLLFQLVKQKYLFFREFTILLLISLIYFKMLLDWKIFKFFQCIQIQKGIKINLQQGFMNEIKSKQARIGLFLNAQKVCYVSIAFCNVASI